MKFLFLRVLLPLLLFLVLRSVLRTLFASGPSKSAPEPPKVPASGELKRDPVCGTYVSAVAGLHEQVGREMVYFCSEECREKYAARR